MLFRAQLASMVETFQLMILNPRMQKFLQDKEDLQAEASLHAQERQRDSVPIVQEHGHTTPIGVVGSTPPTMHVQHPQFNGHGSNVQQIP